MIFVCRVLLEPFSANRGAAVNVARICLLAMWLASPVLASDELADQIVVSKSERKLMLLRGDEILRSFDIALGLVPEGHKEQEGDFRTPEGEYRLTRRRINSDYFMAIQISYPNAEDMSRARELDVAPGSYIMIHGQPDEPKKPARYYKKFDWTDGCIAVSNAAMVDIWQLTAVNTPITIVP
jgi:murein L,D-transpeptidase YafK